jgi:NADH-quinone oxidoreductase subunit F
MPASAAALLSGARVPAMNGEVGPEEIIGRVERSGLRGRGGGGFPLARKLSAARANAAGGEAFAIANAYDADPDSPLSQTLLRRNPEAVLAGLALAARAIGARRAFLYLRPDAEAEPSWTSQREGLSIEVVRGTGGFMGGEETALLAVLESKRAMARQRPPYPAAQGLGMRPTLVASAETLAWLPFIVGEGAEPRTKLVSVTGAVRDPQVLEVELGTTLQDVLGQAGGVIGELKAVHVGGPTGGLLTKEQLGTKLDFDSLRAAGTHMGSAQVRALGDGVCIVAEAGRLFAYLAKETCGICVPCRVGTKRVQGILEGITSGLGRTDDLPWLGELGDHLSEFSLCGFGITSASILRTSLAAFADDYQAHLGGRCPTGTCAPTRSRRYEMMAQP